MNFCLRFLITLVFVSGSLIAQQPSYTFFRVASDTTARPDMPGPIALNVATRPSIEGQYVVFRDFGFFGSVNAQAIWSCNLVDGTIRKLVDQNTAVPGGTGNFSDMLFDSSPVLKNGVVTFLARDSKALPSNQGIYRVPVTGGPVTRVVNYNSGDPSGANFKIFDTSSKPYGGFTADQKVAFAGNNDANLFGVYTANADGTGITRIADVPHPIRPNSGAPVSIFGLPFISGDTVLFYGQTVFDPSTGFNALYTSPSTGPAGTLQDGSPAYLEVFNSDMPLPGNPNSKFHTRINMGIALEGSTVAFVADDTNSNYHGIFVMPSGGGNLTRVASNNVALPGIDEINFNASFGGLALNQGRILFHASGLTGGVNTHGLYLWQNGSVSRVLQTGDLLDGRKVNEIIEVGPYAMSGNKFVFVVSLVGAGAAVYVGQIVDPAMQVSAVTNAASYASQAISPGEIVTIFGSKMGPASLQSFQLSPANTVPATLANARFLVNGIPAPPLYVTDAQASAIVPFGLTEDTASVVAVYNGNASVPLKIPIAATTAGLFSANSSGTGQGAILNQDASPNSSANPAAKGSTIVLFGTGHGAAFPALVEGQITPVTNIPRLISQPTVTIGGQPATIAYAGPAPGLIAGVLQINAIVPANASSGNLPVVVKFGNDSSQSNFTVAVQ